jgi:conjugative transfer signal peptidase TraF
MRARDPIFRAGAFPAPRTAYLLTAAALVATSLWRSFICLNLVSESMPRGIYLLVRPPGQPRPRLALLCLPPELGLFGRARGYLGVGSCPGGVAALLKPIVAIEGDVVAVDSRGVAVNGELLPRSAPLARDREGRPLTVGWTGPVTLAPGTFLPVSTHTDRSWDGRYWGPLPVSSVRAQAVPLLLDQPLPAPLGPASR